MKQEVIAVLTELAESVKKSHTLISDGTWPDHKKDAREWYEYLIDLIERYENEK